MFAFIAKRRVSTCPLTCEESSESLVKDCCCLGSPCLKVWYSRLSRVTQWQSRRMSRSSW